MAIPFQLQGNSWVKSSSKSLTTLELVNMIHIFRSGISDSNSKLREEI